MLTLLPVPGEADNLIDLVKWIAVAVAIAKGFDWVETALNPAGKKAISDWLRNVPPASQVETWSSAFSTLIDRVFGSDPTSVKFFFRSCIASVLAVAVVVVIYICARPISLEDFEDSLIVLGIFSIPNLLPDYGSLMISRTIVRQLAKNTETSRVACLLVLDAVLKITAATCVIYFCSVATHMFLESSSRPWLDALVTVRDFYRGLPFPFRSGGGLQIGIFFYASLFTSIWVWLYIAGGVLIKGLIRTDRVWSWIEPYLDLETKPLKSIGRVVGVAAGIIYAIVSVAISSLSRISRL